MDTAHTPHLGSSGPGEFSGPLSCSTCRRGRSQLCKPSKSDLVDGKRLMEKWFVQLMVWIQKQEMSHLRTSTVEPSQAKCQCCPSSRKALFKFPFKRQAQAHLQLAAPCSSLPRVRMAGACHHTWLLPHFRSSDSTVRWGRGSASLEEAVSRCLD